MDENGIRILVVDDELGIREGCRKVLVAEGYDVVTAEDGRVGLEIFKKNMNFDVVLADLKMPRMGGIEFIENITKLESDVVILVITAYATIETAVEATKRGAYGYIPKPFTPDELLLPVKNGLEKRSLTLEAKRLRMERANRLLEVAFERTKSRSIINCMTDSVLVVNNDRQVVLKNASATRVIPGCDEMPLHFSVDKLECVELRDLILEALEAGSEPLIFSKEIKLGDCTYMVNASSVSEPNGKTLGAVAVLRDITALKKLELAKSMFVSMVAHEIKSPIATVEGYLNVILSGAAGEDPKRDRKMLERSLLRSKTLRLLVSELMSLTAIETGNFSIKRQELNLAEVVSEITESFVEKAANKQIQLTFNCPNEEKKELVFADRNVVQSIMNNLVDNALKYTPEGGMVCVSIEDGDAYMKVSVADNGIGMSEEDRNHAFDEFFRARNKYTASIPGTGLGLHLVKRLVDLHQGKISVESEVEKGSSFTVSIPKMGQIRGDD